MESIILKAIEALYKIAAGGQAYKLMVQTADALMNEEYDNDTKRKMVIDAAMPILKELGKYFAAAIVAFIVDSLKAEAIKRGGGLNGSDTGIKYA